MSTGYYLLDNDPVRVNFHRSRNAPLLAIVVHVTAGLEDLDTVDDHSAERTAEYARTVRDRKVSWHGGSDTDSIVRLLPPTFTAFHCQGYNSVTFGWEISKKHTVWSSMSERWVERTLFNAAEGMRPVAQHNRIPIRLASRAELDREKAKGKAGTPVGFISHATLDPKRRSDPGADFPWERFFALLRHAAPPVPPPLTPNDQEDNDMPPRTVCPASDTSALWAPLPGGLKKIGSREELERYRDMNLVLADRHIVLPDGEFKALDQHLRGAA